MQRSMKAALAATLMTGTLSVASAQDAVCSKDGKALYAIGWKESRELVEKIELPSGKRTELPLPPIGKDESIAGIARSNSGFVLVALPSAVWAINPETGKSVTVCKAPEGRAITGIAYDAKTSATVITAMSTKEGEYLESLWLLGKDTDQLSTLVNRRASAIEGMTFLDDGRVVFAARGDLWVGTISEEESDGEDPKAPKRYALEAQRFAPVASWETMNGTSNSYGAHLAVALGDKLVVHLGRLGGSGDGTIITLPTPSAKDENTNTIAAMAKCLSSVQTLGTTGTRAFLCATPDGKQAYFETTTADGQKSALQGMDVGGKVTALGFAIKAE